MYGASKRLRLGDSSAGLVSTGQTRSISDSIVHYNSNLTVNLRNDPGVVQNVGEHGRFAVFRDTRTTALLPDTASYTVGLTRAEISTNNIPLFCPQPLNSIVDPVSRKPVWEVKSQPGVSLTWTGPCYKVGLQEQEGSVESWMNPQTESETMTYPTVGVIPLRFYGDIVSPTASFAAFNNSLTFYPLGFNALSGVYYTATTVDTEPGLARISAILSELLTVGGGGALTLSVTGLGTSACTQKITITNNTSLYAVFDFSSTAFHQPASTTSGIPLPKGCSAKSSILQACKVLGFAPGQVLEIAPFQSVTLPRNYQLGFRSTLNLSCYRNTQWVPQDQSDQSYFPTPTDVAEGDTSVYFDCYSYEHFLTQCINPSIQRCFTDLADNGGLGFPSTTSCSLTTQLKLACKALATASAPFDPNNYMVGDGYNTQAGRTYMWTNTVTSAGSVLPNEDNPLAQSWQDLGQSFTNSYVSGNAYTYGDIVTVASKTIPVEYQFFKCIVTVDAYTTLPPLDSGGSINSGWQNVTVSFLQNGKLSLTPNVPAIGTLPPSITFDSTTQLFSLNLDSYGFGGTQNTNVNDGYGTSLLNEAPYKPLDYLNMFGKTPTQLLEPYFNNSLIEDYYTSALNDQARDSWGLTGAVTLPTPPYVVARNPGVVYDERFNFEADDYFHQLFGNWPALRLLYIDRANNNKRTAYVRYIPEAANAGLAVPSPLPLFVPSQPPASPSTVYLPTFRVEGNQVYLYTFPQDYRSVGNMWNPVDTLVLTTTEIPIVNCEVAPPRLYSEVVQNIQPSGQTERILSEFAIYPTDNQGQIYRTQITYAPSGDAIDYVEMQRSTVFNNISWALYMRMRATQTLRPVSISDSGSVNIRLKFVRD